MKFSTQFTILLLFVSIQLFTSNGLYAQKEATIPHDSPEIIQTLPLEIQQWDAHFQQILEERNHDFHDLKGTGYMPYIRQRKFYEQRRNTQGKIDHQKRWEIFQNLRSESASFKSGNPIAQWENIGPLTMEDHGGRMISHAFDPTTRNVLWAGSASGGLWLTEDGGDSWQAMSDDLPSTGIGAIAIHPTDNNTLIVGTGEGWATSGLIIKGGIGVFKSIDRGKTWLPTSLNFNIGAGISVMNITWHPTEHNIVWMGATNGLWKSTDSGDNWNLVMGDGTNHQNFICNDIIITPSNPDLMYTAIEGNGIFKSTDGGENWGKLGGGLPTSDLNIISMSQCDAQPDNIYASIINATNFGLKGVYKTTDGGTNWTKLFGVPNAPCSPQFANFCQGYYNNFIQVSPIDPQLVFFGGVTMWKSDNGGLSWQQRDRLICTNCAVEPDCTMYVDHHDFGFDPHNPTTFYSFNDGGVAKSTDSGDCWENINDGLITGQFFSVASGQVNPDIVIGGLQDHGLQGVDLEEGLDWDRWGFFDGWDVEVDPLVPNMLYGTWYDGTYWRSAGGVHQLASQITSGMDLTENTGAHFAPLRVHPEGDILLGSTQQAIYHSSNRGSSWQRAQSASVVSDLAFSQANPSICYAAAWTNTGWTFYRSEDTGETWKATANSPGWRVTDIKTSGQSAFTIFASRNSVNAFNPHIYKSIDGGENWQPIQGDLPDITVNAIAVDLTNDAILYAATDLGVFITTNDGQNWTEFNDGLPITFVNDIEYNPTDKFLRVATFGRGVWRSPAYSEEVTNIENEATLPFQKIEIYPNPSSNHFHISLQLEETKSVQIRLLNYLGQEVAAIFDGELTAGKHTIPYLSEESALGSTSDGLFFVQFLVEGKGYYERVVMVNR